MTNQLSPETLSINMNEESVKENNRIIKKSTPIETYFFWCAICIIIVLFTALSYK